MHEWSELIDKIALLVGSLTGLATAFVTLGKTIFGKSKAKEKPPDKSEKEVKEEEDTEIYRERWLDAERGYDDLEQENKRLKDKVSNLENQINQLKQTIRRLKNSGKTKRKSN